MRIVNVNFILSAMGNYIFGGSTRIILSHDGKCVWLSPMLVQSKCAIDITHFPFDTQYCNLKIGSWTYDASKLDLRPEGKKIYYTTNLLGHWYKPPWVYHSPKLVKF